ncbi:class D beta-lactamase [Anoxybacterium hadale]|uniref:Class D beta-lactamase n=1 Tax=Anoxybacterium hadale TaxID=3408580 RepID=A0ACD1AFA7_9FIRM|nr:class D beta-lactamase [Clostridiales bacterium]
MKKIICLFLIAFLSFGFAGCIRQDTLGAHSDESGAVIEQQSPDSFPELSQVSYIEVDYGSYFNGINGCAVFYDNLSEQYSLYQKELCEQQKSPCSTFKMISTLMGLKYGVLESEDSRMNYNGGIYPVEVWNADLTLKDAFQKSCIWYFRQVIDKVGKESFQRELENLHYGNRDISKWQGSNTNPLPDLNGFWLDSSLKISPIEQVGIVEKIFEGNTEFSPEYVALLQNLMLVQDSNGVRIYGKTGSGVNGNAWFVGFCEGESKRYYFAVYLEDKNAEASSAAAKEIAMKISNDLLYE